MAAPRQRHRLTITAVRLPLPLWTWWPQKSEAHGLSVDCNVARVRLSRRAAFETAGSLASITTPQRERLSEGDFPSISGAIRRLR